MVRWTACAWSVPPMSSISFSASSRPDERPPPVSRLRSSTKRGCPSTTFTLGNSSGTARSTNAWCIRIRRAARPWRAARRPRSTEHDVARRPGDVVEEREISSPPSMMYFSARGSPPGTHSTSSASISSNPWVALKVKPSRVVISSPRRGAMTAARRPWRRHPLEHPLVGPATSRGRPRKNRNADDHAEPRSCATTA